MMLFASCKACKKTITDPFPLMTAEHFPWECPYCGEENPPLRMRNDVQVVEMEDLGENVTIPGAISLSLLKEDKEDVEAEAASSEESATSTETRSVEEVEEQEIEIRDHISEDSWGFKL